MYLCQCSAYKVANPSCCPLTSRWYLLSPPEELVPKRDVLLCFCVLAMAVMTSDPPPVGLAGPANTVITQPHRREGQRSRFNQRANENIWSWKIKTRNYSGGFIARSLERKFMGVKAYLLISLEQKNLTRSLWSFIVKDGTCRGGR